MPMMAMTTSSSIKVNAFELIFLVLLFMVLLRFFGSDTPKYLKHFTCHGSFFKKRLFSWGMAVKYSVRREF